MAFMAIESSAFQHIFNDLPGVSLPFTCRQTVARRVDSEFNLCPAQLVEELALTCQSIALSLDVWTSKNSKAMLGVIGYWVTHDFQNGEHVLEFTEIGAHTGENMADMLQKTLAELRIEHKLLTITADNAANNETLVSELYFHLQEQLLTEDTATVRPEQLRFQGTDSYVRCVAHVLVISCN
jgi:hypothetical protein